VVTTTGAPEAVHAAWAAAGVDVEVVAPGVGGKGVDLGAVLRVLGSERQVLQAMIEGGGRLHGAFVAEGRAGRIVTYVAPVVLGERGRAAFATAGPDTLSDAPRWRVTDVTALDPDLRITYEPVDVEVAA
jgi:diaminohydroxyphosphoribosylaminopyrimidine deaminase / 5-amino-6-(5-phosphoribosylamino)uracil reductase